MSAQFTADETTPTGDDLDHDRARAGLLAEWEHTASAYPYVTSGMVWEVKRYSLVFDVELPDLEDKDAVRAFVESATVPLCITPGCTRNAAYDSEPPAGGYFSTCDRCGTLPGAGLHAHRHSYSAAQCAANGLDPEHTWTTSYPLHPLVENDEITAWECRKPLPNDGGRCGYVISRADMNAHLAYRRGEAFLCNVANAASFGHGIGPQTNGHEVWAAFKAMRDAWTAAHPYDVR
ncbi:hypothetical protein [Streptomyces sp. NPDC002088]|uniref:hypothetical protein n=1 Tax=Streptomyces sp. NPDC002088 TaxID=3154665 RepID=UPI003327C6DE